MATYGGKLAPRRRPYGRAGQLARHRTRLGSLVHAAVSRGGETGRAPLDCWRAQKVSSAALSVRMPPHFDGCVRPCCVRAPIWARQHESPSPKVCRRESPRPKLQVPVHSGSTTTAVHAPDHRRPAPAATVACFSAISLLSRRTTNPCTSSPAYQHESPMVVPGCQPIVVPAQTERIQWLKSSS